MESEFESRDEARRRASNAKMNAFIRRRGRPEPTEQQRDDQGRFASNGDGQGAGGLDQGSRGGAPTGKNWLQQLAAER